MELFSKWLETWYNMYNLKAGIWVILLIMPRQAPASCEVWQADGGGEIYFNLPPSNDRTSNWQLSSQVSSGWAMNWKLFLQIWCHKIIQKI